MIYDMILVGVSAGGLLDSEQQALDEYAVSAGIKTQADIDEANRRRDVADATIEGILQSENVLAEQRRIDAETLRLTEATTSSEKITAAETEAQAIANVTSTTMIELDAQYKLQAAARDTAAAYSSINYGGASTTTTAPKVKFGGMSPDERDLEPDERDSGGVGVAGTPYKIGVPEIYVPNTGGKFIPLGGANASSVGGATYNVVINNPVPEKSENSVRSALKSISYRGGAE